MEVSTGITYRVLEEDLMKHAAGSGMRHLCCN